MVFAPTAGWSSTGRALGARFAHRERAAEGPAYLQLAAVEAAGLKSADAAVA
jgi:hypothetical protein